MVPLDIAMRLVGEVRERPGAANHPAILWFHETTTLAATADAIAWCSSFANWVAWLCRCPRSKSAAAISWMSVGLAVSIDDPPTGFEVVVLKRGDTPMLTYLDYLEAPQGLATPPAHVGFLAGREGEYVLVVGGNQSDAITSARFHIEQVLGVRRLKLA